MKKLLLSFYFLGFLTSCLLALPLSAQARTANRITDWYIKDRTVDIQVNKDASLDITENILADCGDLPDKHGITYSVPTFYQLFTTQKVKMFITLESISRNGNYETYSSSTSSEILTWKIGDADVTVSGENDYIIKYKVERAIRFGNPEFDEFYWNLAGAFSEIEDDHFVANISFPSEISAENSPTYLYNGAFETIDAGIAKYKWSDQNTLQVESQKTLAAGDAITASVSFPKGIITPPVLSFWEQYGDMIILLMVIIIPLLVFIICFMIWYKNGRDIRLNKSITPEFDIPDKLSPMEFGAFWDNGELKTSRISAAIIGLATKGIIKIEEIPKKGFLSSSDTKLIQIGSESDIKKLNPEESLLLDRLFGGESDILISSLKNKFYKDLPDIKNAAKERLMTDGLFDKKGFALRDGMVAIGIFIIVGMFFIGFAVLQFLGVAALISGVIILIFGLLMPKRTEKGADLLWRMKGFKLYMTTAEKYRQKYNEKENIFERFLPYAMIFGITGLWVKKMKQIYGEDYFNHYMPIWYVGNFNNGFNIDSFESQLSALSSSMASTISSSPSNTGSGGGGFSGGGGGGGSVGGW